MTCTAYRVKRPSIEDGLPRSSQPPAASYPISSQKVGETRRSSLQRRGHAVHGVGNGAELKMSPRGTKDKWLRILYQVLFAGKTPLQETRSCEQSRSSDKEKPNPYLRRLALSAGLLHVRRHVVHHRLLRADAGDHHLRPDVLRGHRDRHDRLHVRGHPVHDPRKSAARLRD